MVGFATVFWTFYGECNFLLPVSWASEHLFPSWWVPAVTAWPPLAVGIWTTCIKDSAPNPYCVWFFHTTKQGSDISWVSYTSALSGHYLPGDSIRSHRLRAPSHRTALPPDLTCHLPLSIITWCLRQAGWKLEVLTTPFCSLIHSLEQVRELSFPTRSLAYYRRIRLEQPDGREAQGNVCLLLQANHLSESSCVPQPRNSKPSPFGFLWRLHSIGMTDEITGHWWLNSISSPFPQSPAPFLFLSSLFRCFPEVTSLT